MTSISIHHRVARGYRRHRLAQLRSGWRQQLIARRHIAEFDRALDDAEPTMRNELLAIREDFRRLRAM